MKKNVLLKLFVFVLFTSAIVVGVNIDPNRSNNVKLSTLALSNVEVLAQNEGGNANNCPGGYCDYEGRWLSCYACCPDGKSPNCGSLGCSCW